MKANQKLVDILQKLVDENPSQRFGQILRNYGFVEERQVEISTYWENEFYKESQDLLKKVEDHVKNRK